jgi:hypothetical protein
VIVSHESQIRLTVKDSHDRYLALTTDGHRQTHAQLTVIDACNKPNVLFGTQAQSKKPKELLGIQAQSKTPEELLGTQAQSKKPEEAKRKAKTRGRRGSDLCSFLKKTRPSIRLSVRADSAIENASRWSVIDRVDSAVENVSRTPNH